MKREDADFEVENGRGDIAKRRRRQRKSDRLHRKLSDLAATRAEERRVLGRTREALAALRRVSAPYAVPLDQVPARTTGAWVDANAALVEARSKADAALELADERLSPGPRGA